MMHWLANSKKYHYLDLTIINIYAANIRIPNYTKQILRELKRQVDNNTIKGKDLTTPISLINNRVRKSIRKLGLELHLRSDGPHIHT